MDRVHFDRLTRMFGTASTRRGGLWLLAALGLGRILAEGDGGAARKKRKKKRNRNRRNAGNNPPPPPASCAAGQKPCNGGCIAEAECCGACPGNQVCCGNVGVCKDIRNDDDFCGQCANGQCPGGAFCANGACGLSCQPSMQPCFDTTCFCGTRVDPAHNGQNVCADVPAAACEDATTCATDADCAPGTLGFRQVCVSGLCPPFNVCADPCA